MTQPEIAPTPLDPPSTPEGSTGDSWPSRRLLWAIAGTCLLGVVAAAVVVGVVIWGGNSPAQTERDRVTDVVDRFAVAVDSDDSAGIVASLCAEEAQEFVDAGGTDPELTPASPVATPSGTLATVTNVTINGEVASADVTLRSGATTRLWLRRETSQWKVCAPAEPATKASPTPSS